MILRIVKWLVVAVIALLAGLALWLYFFPPDLIRVGTGYSAKMVCSNQFVAGRDAQEVLEVDVQSPGHPILGFVSVDVDMDERSVTAGLFGIFGRNSAIYREGLGCAAVPDSGRFVVLPAVDVAAPLDMEQEWPRGERVGASDPDIQAIVEDDAMAGPGMRAIVVVRDGEIVAERYGPGFDAQTPLLGWSMTKTVTAAVIGTLVRDGRMTLDQTALMTGWTGDERNEITVADLLAMSSGLEFNEDYGDVTDVTRMLFLEPDMAVFAGDKQFVGARGSHFSYSSGTSVLLSRIWQNAFDDPAEALVWPVRQIFDPLHMSHAVLEADAAGTLAGSSFMYASGRDWARFGQFLLQDGEWEGRQILPEGFVDWMVEPAPASEGRYGRGQLWLRGPTAGTPAGEHPDAGFDLPEDTFWLLGHDGQSVAVVPSRGLVVVRLGLTPSRLGYKPQAMLERIVDDTPVP